MRMNDHVWGKLPNELLERVVAFLPLPALSRFRVTSEEFNAWIISRQFRELCNGLPQQKSRIYVHHNNTAVTVEVSATAGSFNFDHVDLQPYLKPESQPLHLRAEAGGLVYVTCSHTPRLGPQQRFEFVYNLETRTCLRLPPPRRLRLAGPNQRSQLKHAMIAVDANTRAFKVVFMEQVVTRGVKMESWVFNIYDSLLEQWWKSNVIDTWKTPTAVFHQCAVLYDKICILLRRLGGTKTAFDLVSFTNSTATADMCEEVVAEVPEGLLMPKLVVSGSRMLLVGGRGAEDLVVSSRYTANISVKAIMLQIWEVNLSLKKFIKIAQMPDSMFQRVMFNRYYSTNGLIRKDPFTQVDHTENLAIGGCSNCIFIKSSYRRPVIYDLDQDTWRTLNLYPNTGGNAAMFKCYIDVETD